MQHLASTCGTGAGKVKAKAFPSLFPLHPKCTTKNIKLSVVKVLVAQLCPILCDSIYSPPGSSDHGIFQARILEWIAISFSRESSQPRD